MRVQRISLRPVMAACASLASLCAATAVQQANAQAVSVASALEEITVTARRREESLQDIPVAVSAFSDEELRALQADNLSALSGAVPNLNLVQGRGSATSANVFIRGIGQPDALQTFDPAAGVYVDDIYMSRIQGALFELYDVERVEVLRGPQGTLYGKNTIAGAIKLVSKRPSDELTGQIELMGGDYDRFDLKAYVSGPLSDTVSFSLAGLTSNRDGIVADPATGKEYNDIDTQAGRAILRFAPSDRFDATVSLDYTRQRNALTLGRNEADLIAVDLAPITAPPVVVLTPARTGEFDYRTRTSFANDEGQTLDHWGGSLTLNWHLGDAWSFKSITAYRELEPDLYIDIDATEFELGDVFVGIDQDQLSQEFQLLFDGGGRWQAVFGLYYLDENVESLQLAFADDFLRFNGTPLPFERMVGDELENKSYAAFAHVSVDLTDRLSGSLGVRYTQDEKDYFRTTTTNLDPTPFDYVDDDSWDAVTPSATLEYAFTPDAMTYLSVARGFKSGGFNGRANSVADTGSFDPEYVWTYELGYKGQWNGGRLTTNAAVFYSDYTDFQARVGDADPLGFRFPVLNAGELEIYGAELEVVAVPVDALQLRAAIGYLSADYKEFEDCRPQYGPDCDHSGEEPPFAPEWTAGLGLSYTIPLTVRTALTFGVDGNFKAKHWLSVDNRDVLTQDDFWLVNALATLRGTDGGWWVSVGGKNLTDEVYKTDAQEFAAVGNIQTAYYGDPRTWSIALGFAF